MDGGIRLPDRETPCIFLIFLCKIYGVKFLSWYLSLVKCAKLFNRLFYHECLRVFHDRLINVEDKTYFYRLMSSICNKYFQTPILDLPEDPLITHPPMLLFGDFINSATPKEQRVYCEMPDINKLITVVKVCGGYF